MAASTLVCTTRMLNVRHCRNARREKEDPHIWICTSDVRRVDTRVDETVVSMLQRRNILLEHVVYVIRKLDVFDTDSMREMYVLVTLGVTKIAYTHSNGCFSAICGWSLSILAYGL